MCVPTEEDWRSEPWCIDTPWAYRNFFGLTLNQVRRLFERNMICSSEDFSVMPCRVFRYYIHVYIAYLMSDAASEDSIAASAFISLVTHRIKFDPNEIRRAWDGIEPVLKKLALEQHFYAADWAAYGDFRTQINEIVKQGFAVSFDTTGPERVPDGVTIGDLWGSRGAIPAAIAIPILVNSGISGITCTSTRQQIITALGDPDCEGGGVTLWVSRIPEWIRYDRSDARLLFYFEDGQIDSVTVMSPWLGCPPREIDNDAS